MSVMILESCRITVEERTTSNSAISGSDSIQLEWGLKTVILGDGPLGEEFEVLIVNCTKHTMQHQY